VDRLGIHPVQVGRLPGPLAAMNQSNVTVQHRAWKRVTGDPELVVAATRWTLTSGVLSLKGDRDRRSRCSKASATSATRGKTAPAPGAVSVPGDGGRGRATRPRPGRGASLRQADPNKQAEDRKPFTD
jgi:hypothetical protein